MINAMVAANTIADIAKKEGVSADRTLNFGSACYNAGMIAVIRSVAILDFERTGFNVSPSKSTKECMPNVENTLEILINTLHRLDREVFEIHSEALQELHAKEQRDYYIEGFIRGYSYLKDFITFHTDHEGDFE
jgi:hypothetical protein